MSGQQSQLDLAKIDFPTDRLSVKKLREQFSGGFDRLDRWGEPEPVGYFHDHATPGVKSLVWMLNAERAVAARAFALADTQAGRERTASTPDRGERELAAALVEFGLATGAHHAAQQIRDIQTQAAAQAKGVATPQRRRAPAR